MIQDFYALRSDPFRLSPDHAFCLRHPSFAKAEAYMEYALHQAEGFIMVTGQPGTGKTTLIDDLLARLQDQGLLAARLVSAQLEAMDLLRMTAFNFGIPVDGADKAEVLMNIQGFLADQVAQGRRPLLIIDEAQGLSLEAMEELRLLTNLRVNGRPILQIFLVGQEELRNLVLDPRMEQLHQRLIATCHLEPLDARGTAQYVLHRLRSAGWKGDPRLEAAVFPPIHRFSRGVPRRINLFCSRLLLHGALEARHHLTEADALAVLAELKSEHLSPTSTPSPLLGEAAIPDLNGVLQESPDQRLGRKLMDQAPRTAATPPAEDPQPTPAPQPPATPPGPAPATASPTPPPTTPAKGRLWGLAASLALAFGIFLTGLLTLPCAVPDSGIAATLWRLAGVGEARHLVHRWSGGRLPLFSLGPVLSPRRTARLEGPVQPGTDYPLRLRR